MGGLLSLRSRVKTLYRDGALIKTHHAFDRVRVRDNTCAVYMASLRRGVFLLLFLSCRFHPEAFLLQMQFFFIVIDFMYLNLDRVYMRAQKRKSSAIAGTLAFSEKQAKINIKGASESKMLL